MRERERKRQRKRASAKYHCNIHTLKIDTIVRQSESNYLRITTLSIYQWVSQRAY